MDDETHRRARIRAARMGRSLSSLVREALEDIGSGESEFERLHKQELALREEFRGRGFRAGDRLRRDEVHDRDRDRKEWREAEERQA